MKISLLSLILLLTAFVIFGVRADDADVGAPELALVQTIVTGNLGFVFGLIVAGLGLFTIIKGNMGGGVTLIILGVLVTLAPSVYSAVRGITCPIAEALGATCPGDNRGDQ